MVETNLELDNIDIESVKMSILDLPCIGHTPEIDWQKLQAQNLEVEYL